MSTHRPSLAIDFSAVPIRVLSPPRPQKIWGWAIYRTFYTPESDEQWEEVKHRLYELQISDFEAFHSSTEPGELKFLRDGYRTFMLEDEEKFNNASPEDLEVHFQEWAQSISEIDQGKHRLATWKAFLVLNEKAFQSILSVPGTNRAQLQDSRVTFKDYTITAVSRAPEPDNHYIGNGGMEYDVEEADPDYQIVDGPPSWPGQFEVSVCTLYTFFGNLDGDETVMED